MIREAYYSQRHNLDNKNHQINLDQLKDLFDIIFKEFIKKDYFREKFGFFDGRNYISGTLGDDDDIKNMLFKKLRKYSLWPYWLNIEHYTEDDLFDIIEFIYDNISKPHYNNYFDDISVTYDIKKAQKEYRQEINSQLKDYNEGYEIDRNGNVVRLIQNGFLQLIEKEPPTEDEDVKQRIDQAIKNYRKRNSTLLERKESVRHLADILEKLRPKIKEKITNKDEDDLFNIINNFGIRHNNDKQKTEYDESVWISWMFYYYLATVHACLLLIKKE